MSIRARLLGLALGVAGILTSPGCARDAAGPGPVAATASVPFYAQFPSFVTPLSTVVITVTGAGIPAPLVFNLTLTGGVASGTITVPVGPSRTITVEAVDAGGVVAYRGTTTVAVVAGTNPAVAITLVPLTGSVPVTATVGTVVVVLTPPTLTLRAGTTSALTAAITDGQGTPVAGTATFASTRPPAAVTSPAGVVTALDTGTVGIVASAFGAAAQSTLTITPGTTLRSIAAAPATVASGAGGTVTLNVVAADAGTGIDSVRVDLSAGAAALSCLSTTPSAGTRAAGTFACPVVVAPGTAAATYTVSRARLYWTDAGTPRTTDLSADAVLARGVLATLTVTP